MSAAVTILDEATIRRIVGEELDRRLSPILTALERAGRPADAPGLMTREQLAEFLQVEERTLRRLERQGALPRPARIGGRIDRWRTSEVNAWLESGAPALPQRQRAGSCVSKGDRRS